MAHVSSDAGTARISAWCRQGSSKCVDEKNKEAQITIMSAKQLIRFDVLCSTTLLLEMVAQAHTAMQSTDT